MITIKQHLCMFLVASELDTKKQKEFFYRMCTALGYDNDKMVSLSEIYSIYGLFDSKPLYKEDVAALKKLAPCSGCTALKKRTIYKNFPLEEKACKLCVFSEKYQNARMHDEMMVLRYLLMPDSTYEYYQIMPEKAFTSLHRLCSDYAIGSFPVIPFHLYLYRYLENNKYNSSQHTEFINGLMYYISEQMAVVVDMEKYRERIETYFNTIIRINESTLTDDVYNLSAKKLRTEYSYTPPVLSVKPVESGNPAIKTKRRKKSVSRTKEISGQKSLFNMSTFLNSEDVDINTRTQEESIQMNLQDGEPTPSDEVLLELYEQDEFDDSFSNLADNSSNFCNAHNDGSDVSEEFNRPSAETNKHLLVDNAEDEHLIISNETDENSVKDNSVENNNNALVVLPSDDDIGMPNVESIRDMVEKQDIYQNIDNVILSENNSHYIDNCSNFIAANSHKYNANNMTEFFTETHFSEDFSKQITVIQRNNTFSFIIELEQNTTIPVETVIFHEREGFLLYLPKQKHYFFYDIEVFGPDMLLQYFCGQRTTAISANTIMVMSLLDIGYDSTNIIRGMDVAHYTLTHDNSFDLYELVRSYANKEYDGSSSFLEYAMPLYQYCIAELYKKLQEQDLLSKYHRSLHVLGPLSKTLQSHKLFCQNKAFVTMPSYFHFNFHFNWSDKFKVKGQVFRIELPELELADGFGSDGFVQDVCLCFHGLHHTSKKKVYLLSVTSKALYIYYSGRYDESIRFYDSIISRLQKAYYKRYKKPIETNTSYVIYE